jgi:alkylated DNA repair dioxygenase AlkB
MNEKTIMPDEVASRKQTSLITIEDAEIIVPGIILYRNALREADAQFVALQNELKLRQEFLNFGGKRVAIPRRTAWYGDPDAYYTYSGLKNEPLSWTPSLATLRAALNRTFKARMNSCLVNLYRDGSDSMSWHADDEASLRHIILSVSFGESRTFQIREGTRGPKRALRLDHASILLMTIESQFVYRHAVPKEIASGARLNLTFREVSRAYLH